jgi:hypothetical protein
MEQSASTGEGTVTEGWFVGEVRQERDSLHASWVGKNSITIEPGRDHGYD